MNSALQEGATHCPKCDADLDYRLDVADGGGFHYDVTCPPCGTVYFAMSAPLHQMPVAA